MLQLLVEQYELSYFPIRDATQTEVFAYLIDARSVSNAEVARGERIGKGRKTVSLCSPPFDTTYGTTAESDDSSYGSYPSF